MNSLTLGNYQNGVYVPTLYRYKDPKNPGGFKVKTGRRFIEGTGIPASTLDRFNKKIFKPSKKSIQKITSFERKIKYAYLRASGVSKTEAIKARYYSEKDVREIMSSYRAQAQHHANESAKLNWMKEKGLPSEIADKAKQLPINKVIALTKKYSPDSVPKDSKDHINAEISRLTLYIMAGFAHSELQTSDIEDIYGGEVDNSDSVESMYEMYDNAQLGDLEYDEEE